MATRPPLEDLLEQARRTRIKVGSGANLVISAYEFILLLEYIQELEKRNEVLEVVRQKAAGVVRTAHPDVMKDAVVPDWWKSLVTALKAASFIGR